MAACAEWVLTNEHRCSARRHHPGTGRSGDSGGGGGRRACRSGWGTRRRVLEVPLMWCHQRGNGNVLSYVFHGTPLDLCDLSARR
jgi:hypothetical protein